MREAPVGDATASMWTTPVNQSAGPRPVSVLLRVSSMPRWYTRADMIGSGSIGDGPGLVLSRSQILAFGGEPARSTGAFRTARSRCGARHGPGSRTACRGPPCSRCTRASRACGRPHGRIRRSSRSGARGTRRTWSPRSTWRVFTLGRLPDAAKARRRAEETAASLHAHLGGERRSYAEAGECARGRSERAALRDDHGRVVIRWDGARRPTVWTVPAPACDPPEARSSSRAGICTSSARRPMRRSHAGPGSRPRRGRAASRRWKGR